MRKNFFKIYLILCIALLCMPVTTSGVPASTAEVYSSSRSDEFESVREIRIYQINYYGFSNTYKTKLYHKKGTSNEYYNFYLQGPGKKFFPIEKNSVKEYSGKNVSNYKYMCRMEHLTAWF